MLGEPKMPDASGFNTQEQELNQNEKILTPEEEQVVSDAVSKIMEAVDEGRLRGYGYDEEHLKKENEGLQRILDSVDESLHFEIIKRLKGETVAYHFDKFKGVDKSDLAAYMIDHNYGQSLIYHVKDFSDIEIDKDELDKLLTDLILRNKFKHMETAIKKLNLDKHEVWARIMELGKNEEWRRYRAGKIID